MLKDKEITMLTQGNQEQLNIESEEDLRFEESYNVTNISDTNTLNNDVAEDQNM